MTKFQNYAMEHTEAYLGPSQTQTCMMELFLRKMLTVFDVNIKNVFGNKIFSSSFGKIDKYVCNGSSSPKMLHRTEVLKIPEDSVA